MMRRTPRRLRLCGVLLALNLLFIWGNSMLPAETSGAISDWVRSLLSTFLPPAEAPSGGYLVRKLAHFSEFACLGLLLTWLLGMLSQQGIRRNGLALLGGFLSACVDETIQIFPPGRSPGIQDVLLDTCGVAAGIGLLVLVHFCWWKLYGRRADIPS